MIRKMCSTLQRTEDLRWERPKNCVTAQSGASRAKIVGKGVGAKTVPLHRHISGDAAACQGTAGSVGHTLGEVDHQLGVDDAPILAPPSPFPGDVHHGQVQHFQQTAIGGENRLGLGHLAKLAVKALNDVGGIDQPPDFLGILEISTEIGPVVPPGAGNLGIFLVPAFRKDLQGTQGGVLIHCRVYRLEIRHERLQILVGDIPGGIADLVDDVEKYLAGRYRTNA